MEEAYKIINKDAWHVIGRELHVHDLVNLRATCKLLNTVVKSMNTRWFRAHQWFLCRNGTKSKVKSAVKKHYGAGVTWRCVPRARVLNNNDGGFVGYHEYQQRALALIESGDFTEEDCTDRYHWHMVVPTTESDIPLKKYNKRNCYMYWYLIECYRIKGARHEEELRRLANEVVRLKRRERELVECLERVRKRIPDMEVALEAKKTRYHENSIFKDTRVTSYKGI